ncbi:hypothetical protein WISP_01535 [Willisornis vidua]|uniref:Uncharacterized protein n=1 Tax=Willisornis vidua TaxID=1566151 RepID=A0ABQ9E0Q4_9PASS|nr:hypothetical protein WISP_01535 [Willisornis vidua]
MDGVMGHVMMLSRDVFMTESCVWEDIGMMRRIIPPLQGFPLISLFPYLEIQFLASGFKDPLVCEQGPLHEEKEENSSLCVNDGMESD